MHLFDSDSKFMGGWGVVGGHVPLANGVGWAIKHRKEERVAFVILVMVPCIKALSLKLSVWLNCINFHASSFVKIFCIGTSLDRQSAITDLHKRATRRWNEKRAVRRL